MIPTLDKLGIIDGCPVIAVTDSAGPNVIVGGSEYDKHYLSPNYKDHKIAIRMGNRIVKTGIIPKRYTNMKDESKASPRSMDIFLRACYQSQIDRDNKNPR